MPTNTNAYNTRLTSEDLERRFREVFPSQGGAELVDDLYAQGTIVPVIDFTSVAEGSVLPENLQTAWDLATGHNSIGAAASATIINSTGFWLVDAVVNGLATGSASGNTQIQLVGVSSKILFKTLTKPSGTSTGTVINWSGIVFVKAGESIQASCSNEHVMEVSYRQIASVDGTLTNPLGFSF